MDLHYLNSEYQQRIEESVMAQHNNPVTGMTNRGYTGKVRYLISAHAPYIQGKGQLFFIAHKDISQQNVLNA